MVAIANVVGKHYGFNVGLDADTATIIVAGITPVLVWFWPNAPKDQPNQEK